jgi:predicted nucleic acid-binding protein
MWRRRILNVLSVVSCRLRLIAAAAMLAGCGILYSEDLQAGQVLDGQLTIVNPFR